MSEDGLLVPSTRFASRSHTTIASGDRSSYDTPDGLITSRSAPGTLADTFPAVHTTRPFRGNSACSAATSTFKRSIVSRNSAGIAVIAVTSLCSTCWRHYCSPGTMLPLSPHALQHF